MLLAPMERDAAERLAISALTWLGRNPDHLGRFLANSGAAPEDLRAGLRKPEFLGFVLDFLLADEALLLEFCEASSLPPDAPSRARAGLPGGQDPHWS